MESQINASDSYTENKSLGVDRNPRIDGVSPPVNKNFFVVAWILRLLAICATLVAAIVMGTNKQTAMVAIQVPPDTFGEIIITTASAKYYYSPAFIFFVVANAIACGYTVLSLIPGGRLAFKSGVYSLKPAFLVAVADLDSLGSLGMNHPAQ